MVRLKGGDPFLFGRGGEEAVHLGERGIGVEVLPGVTAGIAAPAAAGIPVTYRGLSSSVTFVTGHEDPTKGEPSVDWSAMAKLVHSAGTCCIYMGVGRLPAIAAALTAGGLTGDTPAAAVSWGTLPPPAERAGDADDAGRGDGARGRGGPGDRGDRCGRRNRRAGAQRVCQPPSAGSAGAGPPDAGAGVRAAGRAGGAGSRGDRGPDHPKSNPRPRKQLRAMDAALRDVASYDWLILTSVNGVAAVADRLAAMRLDARAIAGPRVAVVGEATAATLWDRLRCRAELLPEESNGPALARALIASHAMHGTRILMLRAAAANPDLPRLLTDAGAAVTDLAAYRTLPVQTLPAEGGRGDGAG